MSSQHQKVATTSLDSSMSASTIRRYQWAARYHRFREAWSIFRRNRIAVAGVILLFLFALFPVAHAILRNTIWDDRLYDPIMGFALDSAPNPAPPSWIPINALAETNIHRFDQNRPSFAHILGTDTLGRDVLSVLLASTLNTFLVGLTAGITTAVIGLLLASVSAYYRGRVDGFITHISDAFLLLPAPIFMIVVGVFLQSQRTIFTEIVYDSLIGGGINDELKRLLQPIEFGLIYGVIAGAGGATIVLRSHGIKVITMSFIEAAHSAGAGAGHVIFRHLIPHMLPLAGVYMLVVVTGAIVADAFLSFFGINPNPLNWGTMIYEARQYLVVNAEIPWHAMMAPAVAISLFAAAFFMISRGIHEVIEPRLREVPVAQDRLGIKHSHWYQRMSGLEAAVGFLALLALILLVTVIYVVILPRF
jgi:peptide/nickel transport system permease protein